MDPVVRKAAVEDNLPALLQRVEDLGTSVLLKKDADNISAVHVAAEHGSVTVLSYILEEVNDGKFLFEADDDLRRPLHWAAWKGKFEAVRILLEYNCKEREKTRAGFSALHYAAITKDEDAAIKIIQLLVKNGLNLEEVNDKHETCLDIAKLYKKTKVVQYISKLLKDTRVKHNSPKKLEKLNNTSPKILGVEPFIKKSTPKPTNKKLQISLLHLGTLTAAVLFGVAISSSFNYFAQTKLKR